MQIQAPKGTKDITPKESYKWQYVEGIIREICAISGFCETRTPTFEYTELFARGVGDTSDIVQKEMYTFLDKGERSITLKPEGTAGVVRMFLENKLFNEAQPTKMYYLYSPVFRYDKPQAGRYREHHQFGVELFGAPRASADAECIALALKVIAAMGMDKLAVSINSIGCPNCRPNYNTALKAYLNDNYVELCPTCKSRFEKNPMRILDCKEPRCAEIAASAPKSLDYLCEECSTHFDELKACLDTLGISYKINPMVVRGLDYYTKTVFEVIVESEVFSGAICGGGRYDSLIESLGGPKMPAVGFGIGMERLLLMAEQSGFEIPKPDMVDVYIAVLGENARRFGFRLADEMRHEGICAEFDHVGRSFKAQFKYADKIGAKKVVIIGDDEVSSGVVKLKDMTNGEEKTVPFADLIKTI